MYNKKTLSKATAELDKAKAPKKPKDIITDPMGQWKYPGLPTRIPGNDITMQGVGYPVLGVANNGQRKIMLPGADYTFPGADYVDEYPQMKKGGERKRRKTKSISGTNKIMQKNPLFKDYKNRVYDPNVDYFQDGGYIEAELTDDEIEEYRKGGYIVEDISVPELNQAKKGKIVNTSKSPKPSVYTAKNDKDYAFRKKAYDDSLAMYNLSTLNNMLANNYAKDPDVSEKEQIEYVKKNDAYIQKMKNVKAQALTKFGDVYGKQTKPTQTIVKPYKPEADETNKKSNTNKTKETILEISDPKEFAYRDKMYKEEKPKFETKTSGHTYEDSLKTYNNYLKRKEVFDNVKPDTFKSHKELNDFQKKLINDYPTDYNLALEEEQPRKKVNFQNGDSSTIQIAQYKKPTGSKPAKQSKYPVGYQPYSLYGKVLDPEVYGYAESLNGKPVQVAQFADTYGYKAKMDTYKKSGKYPWAKQKGGAKDKYATHIGDDGTVGTTSVHTDKKGNITTKVQDSKGITHYKVKTKDGKVFYKQDASTAYPENNSISPEHYKIDPRQIEMNDGALQSVDDFWTLPIGMTSAGVKGAVGLVKGLTSLGRTAAKSSLGQATKAGTKAFFNTSIKNLPGANLKNLINVGFAGAGVNEYMNENSDVRRATKNAYDNPTGNNIINAINENAWNALNFSGLNVGKGVKQLGKYATTQTPLKNAYKLLPEGTFKNYSKLKTKGKSYRVAGLDAYEDFLNTGVVKSSDGRLHQLRFVDNEGITRQIKRPTGFPSFQKDYADLRYLPNEGGVVFETSLPTFKRGQLNPVTGERIKGSHYAHRVIDPQTGTTLTEIPASDIDVYEGSANWLKGHKKISKQLPGSPNAVNDVQKAGFLNPFAIVDRIIPRLPVIPTTVPLGVGDDFVNYSPLNLIPGYGKRLAEPGFTTPINSGNTQITAYRKFGNSLEDLINSKSFKPEGGSRIGADQIKTEGNWAEAGIANEWYNGVYAASMNPKVEGTNIQLQKWEKRNGVLGLTKEGNPAIPITDPGLNFHRRLPFSNKYVSIDKQKLIDGKFQLATQLPHVQSLIEKYGRVATYALVLGYMMGGKKGAMENLKTVNKYSVDPVIDWSKKQWDSFDKTLNKKKQGGAINDAVYTDLTDDEIQDYIKQGYIVEDVE